MFPCSCSSRGPHLYFCSSHFSVFECQHGLNHTFAERLCYVYKSICLNPASFSSSHSHKFESKCISLPPEDRKPAAKVIHSIGCGHVSPQTVWHLHFRASTCLPICDSTYWEIERYGRNKHLQTIIQLVSSLTRRLTSSWCLIGATRRLKLTFIQWNISTSTERTATTSSTDINGFQPIAPAEVVSETFQHLSRGLTGDVVHTRAPVRMNCEDLT